MNFLGKAFELYFTSRLCTLAVYLAALASATGAIASTAPPSYPTRPITLIVPFAAGGATDLLARLIAEKLKGALGQAVIVENRSGGPGASIGANYVARSAPDGYTLLLGSTSTHSVGPSIFKLPYDPIKDFTPVTLAVRLPQCVAVNSNMPISTVQEMMDFAKKNPDKFTVATAGNGTLSHLQNLFFQSLTKAQFVSAHYRGSNPALIDLVSGNVQAMFDNVSSIAEYHKAGQVRILAVTTAQRSPSLPDVPTIAESVPDYEASGWIGILAPAGTPASIVDKLSQSVASTLDQPDIRKDLLDRFSMDVATGTPQEFAQMLNKDIAKWRNLVATVGIQPE